MLVGALIAGLLLGALPFAIWRLSGYAIQTTTDKKSSIAKTTPKQLKKANEATRSQATSQAPAAIRPTEHAPTAIPEPVPLEVKEPTPLPPLETPPRDVEGEPESPDLPDSQVTVAGVGKSPRATADGSIECVKRYLRENLDDLTGLEYISWSGVAVVRYTPFDTGGDTESYWGVRVKFRAKNGIGVLRLYYVVFLIQNDEVQRVVDMNPPTTIDRQLVHQQFPPGKFPGEGPLRKSRVVEEQDAVNREMEEFLDPSKFIR